jgi:hypothetical protein
MSEFETWYVTFGVGTPDGQLYTEVKVPLDNALFRVEREELARKTTFERYGKAWAFIYPHEQYLDSIGRYNLRLRETITAKVPA